MRKQERLFENVDIAREQRGDKIGKVYVSLTGQSLHTLEFRERTMLSPGGILTQEVVDNNRSAKKYTPDMQTNYAVADVEYYVDAKTEKNPVGVAGPK